MSRRLARVALVSLSVAAAAGIAVRADGPPAVGDGMPWYCAEEPWKWEPKCAPWVTTTTVAPTTSESVTTSTEISAWFPTTSMIDEPEPSTTQPSPSTAPPSTPAPTAAPPTSTVAPVPPTTGSPPRPAPTSPSTTGTPATPADLAGLLPATR